MLKRIDFTLSSGIEYVMLYDSSKMTEEQAMTECKFVGWGGGHNYDLFPHYLILDKKKLPMLLCIKDYILKEFK